MSEASVKNLIFNSPATVEGEPDSRQYSEQLPGYALQIPKQNSGLKQPSPRSPRVRLRIHRIMALANGLSGSIQYKISTSLCCYSHTADRQIPYAYTGLSKHPELTAFRHLLAGFLLVKS